MIPLGSKQHLQALTKNVSFARFIFKLYENILFYEIGVQIISEVLYPWQQNKLKNTGYFNKITVNFQMH